MPAPVPEPTLSALVQMLAEQSLIAMGVPHPMMDRQPPANPAAARFFIELLALLQARTEGHRTPQETREMEDMLYQLRLRAMDLQSAPTSSPETR